MGLWSILIMGMVGGLIGWLTNFFAIGMLFRPYEPVKIGKFQLPFTPGVIPKRRKDIARSIGKIVGRDLIHPDKMIAQILNPKVKTQLMHMMENMVHQAFASQHTPKELCIKYLGVRTEQMTQLEASVIQKVQTESEKIFARTLKSLLEDMADVQKEVLIEKASREIQGLLVKAMDEPGFRQVLVEKVEEFITNLGFIAKVVTQVVQAETIADKMISGIQPYTRSETVYTFIFQGLRQTWNQYENRPVGEVLQGLGLLSQKQINRKISAWLNENNPLEQPIAKLLSSINEEKVIAVGAQVVNFLFESEHVHEFLRKALEQFNFEKLVEDEINRLSLPELEAKIYEIASRELFMIQMLGGVLGFMIGVVQALLFIYVL